MTGVSSLGGMDMSQMRLMVGGTSGMQAGQRPAPPDGGGKMEEQVTSIAQEAGLDDQTIESLCEDLRSAVGTAMEGFDGTGDPRQTIEEAVSGVLTEFGIDPDALSDQMSAMGPPPGGMMGQTGDADLLGQMYGVGTSSSDSLTSLLMNLSLVDVQA